MEFRFCSVFNVALWFASLDLKAVTVIPTYVSSLSPHVTVAWYTTSFARHSPSRGHIVLLGQLHFLSSSALVLFLSNFLLFPSIIAFTFGIQLYESFTMFLLKILCRLLLDGKHLVIIFKNSLPILVFTLYGVLYQIAFLFLDLLSVSGRGCW